MKYNVLIVIFIIIVFLLCIQRRYTTKNFWLQKNKKCHNELLRILDVTQEVLTKYNVTYLAGDGTLLGVIRHKGFIPWDDDIDLSILNDKNWSDNVENIRSDLKNKGMNTVISCGGFIQVYQNDYDLHIDLFEYNRVVKPTGVIWESNQWYKDRWPEFYYKEEEIYPIVYKDFENRKIPCINKNIDFLQRAFGKKCLTVAKYKVGHNLNVLEYLFYWFMLYNMDMEL